MKIAEPLTYIVANGQSLLMTVNDGIPAFSFTPSFSLRLPSRFFENEPTRPCRLRRLIFDQAVGNTKCTHIFYFKRRRRAPTFKFALEESLLTFQLNRPALVPLFQLPPAVDGKNGLIAEFKVTNEANNNAQLFNVAGAAKEMLDVDTITATADKGYENATIIAECLRENITPQVAMNTENISICIETEEEIKKPGQHLNGRCIYDKKRNIVICPMGEILKPSYYHKSKNSIAFKNAKACKNCSCKCTIEAFKKFEMAAKKEDFKREYDATNLKVKQIEIKPDKNILKKRKCLSEHPFGIIKRCLDSEYCLTKGIDNVQGEFSLAFLAFNLKRAINILGVKKMMQEICRV